MQDVPVNAKTICKGQICWELICLIQKKMDFLLERAMFFVAWVWCQFAKFKTRA